MPILRTKAHTTDKSELTVEEARGWQSGDEPEIPYYIDDQLLGAFLHAGDKTYDFREYRDFWADLDVYYRTITAVATLDVALKNVNGYAAYLQSAKEALSDELICKALKVAKGVKAGDVFLDVAKGAVARSLAEEATFVAECRVSLEEQLKWHKQGKGGQGQLTALEWDALVKTLVASASTVKEKGRYTYYTPIRNKLMSMGFVVCPTGTALGAVFPCLEWIADISERDFRDTVKDRTDRLMARYRLLGDDASSLTRLLLPTEDQAVAAGLKKNKYREFVNNITSVAGCICVSWTRHRQAGKVVYVPVLGLSGIIEEEPKQAYFEKYCRHLALPSWEPDPVRAATPFTPDEAIKREEAKIAEEYNRLLEQGKTGLKTTKNIDVDLTTPDGARKADQYLRGVAHAQPDSDLGKLVIASRAAREKLAQQIKAAQEKHGAGEVAKDLEFELSCNYETMIRRTNLAALEYRARAMLELRRPARQALLSYVSFRQNSTETLVGAVTSPLSVTKLQAPELGVDTWICGWHSLNCAEPAALMTASSIFCDGCDVLICFPYEGINPTGASRNRPKETCPWCAAVELGFRSLSANKGKANDGVATGNWLTQLTLTLDDEPKAVLPVGAGFDARDDRNEIMGSTRKTLGGIGSVSLVRNRDLESDAYPAVVETKIGRVRSMYYLLGLLDREVVALDRPLYGYTSKSALPKGDGSFSFDKPSSSDPSAPSGKKKVDPSAKESAVPKLREQILTVVDGPLSVVFSHLLSDRKHLPGGTRGKAVALWDKLTRDKKRLTATRSGSASEAEKLVKEILDYLGTDLVTIVDDLRAASRDADKSKKQLLGNYAQRLSAAFEKLSFYDDVVPRESVEARTRREIRDRLGEINADGPARARLNRALLQFLDAGPTTLDIAQRALADVEALKRLMPHGHSDISRLETVSQKFEELYFMRAMRNSRMKDCGARGNCAPLSTADHFAPNDAQRRAEIAVQIRADVAARLQADEEIAWYVESLGRLQSVTAAWIEALAVGDAGEGRAEIARVLGEDDTREIERIVRAYEAEADEIAADNGRRALRGQRPILPDLARLIPQLADRQRLVRDYGRYVAEDGIYIDQPFLITMSRRGVGAGHAPARHTVLLFAQRDVLRYNGGWTRGGRADLADNRAIILIHGGNHYQRVLID